MTRVQRRPRVHFSFRSPFSWIGLTHLERQVPDLHVRVDLLPFYDPDPLTRAALEQRGAEFHYAPMSKAKHLYILYDVRRQVEKFGLRVTWPVDEDPWWELPHLAWLRAGELGRAAEFYAAVVAARWERGENVCDPVVLRALAEEAGLPGDDMVGAPSVERLRAAGTDSLVAAYEDDVFGVPYFRIGRERFWGLDRVDDFVADLAWHAEQAPAPADPAPAEPVPAAVAARVGGYDTDSAGGCG